MDRPTETGGQTRQKGVDPMSDKTAADYLTTYHKGGTDYRAVQVPWGDVEQLLGRPHDGSPEDDQALVDALTDTDAPDWWHDQEGGIEGGWIDEAGWGVYGPPAKHTEYGPGRTGLTLGETPLSGTRKGGKPRY